MTAAENQETANSNPESYTRLHITPLDPDLLSVVLSSSILPRARNVSYHSIPTFPEKRYGFLELPGEDADKIKQKLNGAVLRGVKIRIAQARPENRPAPLGDAAMASEKTPKREKKSRGKDDSKKRKRDGEEVPGAVLEPGRKIKRGWTVSPDEPRPRKDKDKRDKSDKDKKKKGTKEVKSKYTNHAECLIKTSLPNTTDNNEPEGERKRKKSKSKEVVIHEFEKTTKFPTFLKTAGPSSSKRKTNLEFVDGKGWVDEDGTIVEAVKTRTTIANRTTSPTTSANAKPRHDGQGHSSSSGGTSSDESEDDDRKDESDEEIGSPPDSDDEPTKGDSPSNRVKGDSTKTTSTLTSILKPEPARPQSSSSAKSLTIKIPPATPKVHPLEALYTRPKPANGAAPQTFTTTPEPEPDSAPFSFFANAGSEPDDDDGDSNGDSGDGGPAVQMPMTPFTRQDFESRGIRSAAPTPDTAHMNRSFKLWPRGDAEENIDEETEEDDGEEEEGGDGDRGADGPATAGGSEGPEAKTTSDFQDWFWENRGDLNRSWKKRRKTAAKEKRYRENQARAERAI